jgi:hypothetical protein
MNNKKVQYYAINPKDPEITVLQNAVVEMICEQPSWGEKMPKSWIHLEMVINKKVEKGSKVITFKMVEEINQVPLFQDLSDLLH